MLTYVTRGGTTTDVTKAGVDTTNMHTGGGGSADAGTGHVNAADAVKTTAFTSILDTGMADTANNNESSMITETSDIDKNIFKYMRLQSILILDVIDISIF